MRAVFSRRRIWTTTVVAGLILHSCNAITGLTAPPAVLDEVDEPYHLVWADEFEGDGPLDPARWGHEGGFMRNRELQWYQRENAFREDGKLVIEARRERKPNPQYVRPGLAMVSKPGWLGKWTNRKYIEYTSASVNTRGKSAWMYGRFEVRAKIDVRAGSWPAFWTLGTRGVWPANGEVDVMEFYNRTLLFNAAWAGPNGVAWSSVKRPIDELGAGWADQFHVWRMDWDERTIRFYLDGQMVKSLDLSKTVNAPQAGAAAGGPVITNPFNGPAYLLLNQAIGGTHGGDPSGTAFPVRFEVDYVRVYQTTSQIEATRQALAADTN